MLSLLVWIAAAVKGSDGFTKLTVCDFFIPSDFFCNAAVAFGDEAEMLALFPLRRFKLPALAVSDERVLVVCLQNEEVFALFPAGRRLHKTGSYNVHFRHLRAWEPSEVPVHRR